jgi:hypothetical protein
MKITVVRFVNAFGVGTQLDVRSSLLTGERVLDVPISLHRHDDTFLRIDFAHPTNPYSQLVPWAQVATVLYEETKSKK